MDKVNVYWLSYHDDILARGYWDQGNLEEIFAQGNYEHHVGIKDVPEGQGGIVIINGRTHVEDTQFINEDIAKLAWILFIDTGDEESVFPWREIKHPRMRVWVMLPKLNMHDDVSYRLPNGYRPETRATLEQIGPQDRIYDFFFAGQVTHDRRLQCMEAVRSLSRDVRGYVVETKEFGGRGGLAYPDYMAKMAASKIVLCPSGPESPDNFRLYEALEAGCLPIVDAFSTKHQAPGFWQLLLGNDIPFPIVNYWDVLPELLPNLLRDWPHNANNANAWWLQKKREMKFKLEDDIRGFSR